LREEKMVVKKNKLKLLFPLLALSFLASGCGGGGGSSGEESETISSTFPSKLYLVYGKDNQLLAVNSQDPQEKKIISDNCEEWKSIYHGDVNLSSNQVSNFFEKYVVTIENGKIYKFDLTTGELERVSAISDASYIDYSYDEVNNYPAYIGVKTENGTAIVPLNLPDNQSPSGIGEYEIVDIVGDNSGRPEKALLEEGETLKSFKICNLTPTGVDLTSCSVVRDNIQTWSFVDSDRDHNY